MFAQRATGILIEVFDFLRYFGAGQNAQRLDHAEGETHGQDR
ncbi:MAG: hypothetical protein EpisKO_34630 [Epibacterium sp.]